MLVAQIREAVEEELNRDVGGGSVSESMDVGVDEHINSFIPIMSIRSHNRADTSKPPVNDIVNKTMKKENWELKLRENFKKKVNERSVLSNDVKERIVEEIVTDRKDRAQLLKTAIFESNSTLNNQNNCKNENRGTYLYSHGLRKKQIKEKLAKCIVDERSAKEMEGVTFKPSINTSKLRNQLPLHARTKTSYLQITKEKKAKLTYELMKNWQESHPFRPRINKRSVEIMHERAKSERRFENGRFVKLFEDAKRRIALENKRKELVPDTECTFNPNRELTNNFRGNESVQRRPLYENPMQRKSSLKDSIHEFDLKTGQPLYRPQIGRGPRNRAKTRTKSIGEYLCSLKRKSSEGAEENSGVQFVQEKSNRIVERMRKDGFAMVFRMLDLDNDGMISSQSVKPEKLPKQIVKIFMPIFKEMEEMQCSLNLEEFVDASNNLFRELTIVQKNEFLNLYKSLEMPKRILRNSVYSPYKECSFKVFLSN
eukprot:TRINITY_DN7762_c0_g1_i7.p1 TRINITY_DN7762_c0_g1~~TRINITY_DN7762_c0_g1_i7.p1  ORF type:complete len:484 (+),score=128.89 TRINITY_DN7762_c0_g1_i7:381-1832(+)